jgi:hypothetical protein
MDCAILKNGEGNLAVKTQKIYTTPNAENKTMKKAYFNLKCL